VAMSREGFRRRFFKVPTGREDIEDELILKRAATIRQQRHARRHDPAFLISMEVISPDGMLHQVEGILDAEHYQRAGKAPLLGLLDKVVTKLRQHLEVNL